jgi:DNA-binding NarL/FixJ family response regulator
MASRGAKVLIVEDSPLFRQVLREGLCSRFPFIDVLEAGDVPTGLRIAREHAPDLAFIDIRLPGGNGLELTAKIKDEIPGITVIVCTSHDLPEFWVKGRIEPRDFARLANGAETHWQRRRASQAVH